VRQGRGRAQTERRGHEDIPVDERRCCWYPWSQNARWRSSSSIPYESAPPRGEIGISELLTWSALLSPAHVEEKEQRWRLGFEGMGEWHGRGRKGEKK
jgi:hypothetical protein